MDLESLASKGSVVSRFSKHFGGQMGEFLLKDLNWDDLKKTRHNQGLCNKKIHGASNANSSLIITQ